MVLPLLPPATNPLPPQPWAADSNLLMADETPLLVLVSTLLTIILILIALMVWTAAQRRQLRSLGEEPQHNLCNPVTMVASLIVNRREVKRLRAERRGLRDEREVELQRVRGRTGDDVVADDV